MKAGTLLLRWAAIVGMMYLACCAQSPSTNTDPIPLLDDLTSQDVASTSAAFFSTRRATLVRYTALNPDAVTALRGGSAAWLSLSLRGKPITATRVGDRSVVSDLRVWSGKLSDGGDVRITYRPSGSAVARIVSSGSQYLLEQSSTGGPFALMQIAPSFDEGGVDFIPSPSSSETALAPLKKCDARPDYGIPVKPGKRVDFLLLYTQAAAAGTADIQASIVSAFDSLATAFSGSSNFGTPVRIAALRQISFTEASSMEQDLRTITTSPAIVGLRNANRADVVSLIGNYGGFCGIGWLNENVTAAAATNAFSVVHYGCLAGNTLAHEVGHNFGMRHDLYVDGAGTNNHGYVLLKRNIRTIMAYNNQCAAAGKFCERIVSYSTPDDSTKGDAIGGPRADNREILCRASQVVADFR